jgi:hypothetical protein
MEADGATASGREAIRCLREATQRWEALGRPIDAARCQLLLGRALQREDPAAASEVLASVRETYQRLGIVHQAQRARELAAAAG